MTQADDINRRLDRLLDRVARRVAAGEQLLPSLTSAERHAPERAAAERAVLRAGRETMVRDARTRIGRILDAQYDERALGSAFGAPADPATSDERVALTLALDDLVLAIVAEDLLDRHLVRALSQDGEALLAWTTPSSAAYERAGIAVGGPIDPSATPRTKAQLILGVGAAIVLGPMAFLFGWDRAGTVIGLLIGVVVAVLCLAWAIQPRRRAAPR